LQKIKLPLSKSARAQLADLIHYQNITVPTILTQQNDKADTFYCILAGEVQSEHVSGNGSVTTHTLCAGDTFGLAALLSERPRDRTYSVRQTCELISITRRQFRSLLLPRSQQELQRRLEILVSTDAFRDMGRPHVRQMASASLLGTFKKGDVILSKGSVPFNTYTIVTGTVRVTAGSQHGSEAAMGRLHGFRSRTISRRDVAVMGPGQTFGMNCLLETDSKAQDGESHLASMPVNVVAAGKVELLLIAVV